MVVVWKSEEEEEGEEVFKYNDSGSNKRKIR